MTEEKIDISVIATPKKRGENIQNRLKLIKNQTFLKNHCNHLHNLGSSRKSSTTLRVPQNKIEIICV